MQFAELNNDQGRELINARQRFQAWRNAAKREHGYRGSMVWAEANGTEYLVRSYYDDENRRRQKSLGIRSEAGERLRAKFEVERREAISNRKALDVALDRQAAINQALGLGRVPPIAASILRLLDRRGWLGAGIRVAGTNALYAYEAACAVHFDPEILSTSDIDFLMDARQKLFLIGDSDFAPPNLIDLLKTVDGTFKRSGRMYRAENNFGYMVDLIKPSRNPPWTSERPAVGDGDDLQAAEIEGLVWLENAPSFEQMAIDGKGYPVRLVVPDPRAFAIHKWWVSKSETRDRAKSRRDRAQALAVAGLVSQYMPHLPFDAGKLLMLPKTIVDDALDAFAAAKTEVRRAE